MGRGSSPVRQIKILLIAKKKLDLGNLKKKNIWEHFLSIVYSKVKKHYDKKWSLKDFSVLFFFYNEFSMVLNTLFEAKRVS